MKLPIILSVAFTAGGVAAAAKHSYDYIIVGGGTSGLALATRLSQELPRAEILVLEAGPSALDELRINAPGMRGSALATIYDWNFTTVPQETLHGRSVDVNRGHVLGGSSAINYLCYDRSAASEYDAWGELGNRGWNWDVMIDAMVKSENFTGTDRDLHGYDGPIRSTFNRMLPEVIEPWKPTLNNLGVKTNFKSLSGNPVGVSYQPTNIDETRYTRSYSANSYLPLAGQNLEVVTDTLVANVDFDKRRHRNGLRATGVTLADGTKIRASKEVILSSGPIGSPGLLENSGIGQRRILRAAGIKSILDLDGVGENLQDHVRTSNTYRLKPGFETFDPMIYDPTGEFAAEQVALWLAGEPGWLDYTTSSYAFLNWQQVVGKRGEAKLIKAAREGVGRRGTVVDKKKIELMRDPTVPQLEIIYEANMIGSKPYPGGNFITLFSSLMHPMSRGSVHIDPENPHGKPILDPRFLTNEHDLQAAIAGAKFAREIANTEPMASIWESEYEPGQEVQTDEQWEEFVRNALQTFFHPVGTCAMLPRKDGGVVDSRLVVHGTSNLRVVDTSIIPTLLSAHIQTAAYGIAEIAAGFIIDSD